MVVIGTNVTFLAFKLNQSHAIGGELRFDTQLSLVATQHMSQSQHDNTNYIYIWGRYQPVTRTITSRELETSRKYCVYYLCINELFDILVTFNTNVQWRSQDLTVGGTESLENESPPAGSGAEPLVRGSRAKPRETGSFSAIGCPTECHNLPIFRSYLVSWRLIPLSLTPDLDESRDPSELWLGARGHATANVQ